MRRESPLWFAEVASMWFAFGYQDVKLIAADKERFSSELFHRLPELARADNAPLPLHEAGTVSWGPSRLPLVFPRA
jgi:hypothetical protein